MDLWGVNSNLSRSSADALYLNSQLVTRAQIVHYRLDEGSGSVLKDSSGNGRNATFDGVNDPTWTPEGLAFGLGGNRYVPLPSAVNGARTIMVLLRNRSLAEWSAGIGGQASNCAILNPSNGAMPMVTLFAGGVGTPNTLSPGMYGGSTSTQSNETASRWTVLTWTFGVSGADRNWVDDQPVTDYTSLNDSTGKMTTGYWNLGGGPSYANAWFEGVVADVVVYDSVLTDAEIRQNVAAYAALASQRGLPYRVKAKPSEGNVDNRIVTIGDSITFGYLANLGGWPGRLLALDDPATVRNLAVSGSKAITQRIYLDKQDVVGQLNASAPRNAVFAFLLTNDDPAAVGRWLGSLAKAKATWPSNTELYILTLLSHTGQDSQKNTVNPLVRAFCASKAGQGITLLDVASDPALGADGASTNTTYFVDGLHPDNPGQLRIATMATAAYNYAPYSGLNRPIVITSTTYTMAARDAWLVCGAASAATVTLTPATGHTQERRRITNRSASTVTLTAVAANTELINGATTFALAAGQTVTITSVLRSDAAGGCDWVVG